MAYKLEELANMTENELRREHDEHTRAYPEVPFQIREELARTRVQRQGDLMVKLTIAITVLTVLIAIMTAANVWIVLQT
jgi:hypothetical protein